MIPPELITALTGEHALTVGCIIALVWTIRQWQNSQKEGKEKDADLKKAADALKDQELLNRDAKGQLDLRDFIQKQTQEQLDVCRQELLHYRFPASTGGKS